MLGSSPFFASYKLDTSDAGFLGRGAFSVVRKCTRLSDDAQYAVKVRERERDWTGKLMSHEINNRQNEKTV